MTDDTRVQQLLDELDDSGATPEDVCQGYPELLPAVRTRWRQMLRLRADLDALFPTPPAQENGARPDSEVVSVLPEIPGHEVEAVVGRGGMGIVFRARHVRLNRRVAVKMLLAGAYARPRDQSRFASEAEAEASLRHPNVVQVYEIGEVEGRSYFTMEYVDGGSLAQKLAGTPMPARQAAAFTATLAAAVQAAHARGIIHRDLKPANILLTSDAAPKVSDFGLARRLGNDAGLTETGMAVGTPSYMAPEQARGQSDALGPAVDVYALGAILYELLTGRPPFRAATAAETVQQVVFQEPVPPSRLNAQVPRDLETICLKCLHKTPNRRYVTAQDLADDLHRFLEGKPILARRVGAGERTAKWARRRPAAALLIGSLLVASVATIGMGVWIKQQETDLQRVKAQREGQAREAIETALRRADDLRREERWKEALVVLADVSRHLADANSPELGQRLGQAQSDFRTADVLESARESFPLLPNGEVDYQQRAAEFRTAFELARLSIDGDAEMVAASIRASAVREQFIAAVDDRAFVAFMLNDDQLVKQLLKIARLADPGSSWRDRFRHTEVWGNGDQLQDLAGDAFTGSPPPAEHQLALLGLLLGKAWDWSHSTQVLGEVCRRQPKYFWAHRVMGFALLQQGQYVEAAGCYRVALALRPNDAGALEGLGRTLYYANRTDEGIAAYRRALQLSPKSTSIRYRLVDALAVAGYWKEADAECRDGLNVDPANYLPLECLSLTLSHHGRVEEGLIQCRKVTEIAPSYAEGHFRLGTAYASTARHEEAVTELRKAKELKAIPALDLPFARELVTLGRFEEAISVLQAASAREPTNPLWPFEVGKLLRSRGKTEEAAKAFKTATTLGPALAWADLAAAWLDLGRFAEARAAIKSALALTGDDERRRALRRQLDLCDSLLAIDANLQVILAGKERPTDVPTQLALAEWCLKHKRLPATAAGLYASALATQPSLADNLETSYRFHAARAAALAGCGVGADAGKVDERRKVELRQQALNWLTAEYNAWAERHRRGKPGDRTAAATTMRFWLKNGDGPVMQRVSATVSDFDVRSRPGEDLAGVRDEQALAQLPPDERRAWQELWAKVATLAARDPAAQFAQARDHVARLEWAEAATCYAAGMELEPTEDGDFWFEYAASQLLAGDRPGFRRACAHMLARCQPAGPMRPYLVARACTLAPDSTADPRQPFLVSVVEIGNAKTDYWALTEQAALHLRAGQMKDSISSAERSLMADGRTGRAVLNWLWLALAYQKLGNPSESRRWLNKAANWLDQQDGQMPRETQAMGLHRHNWLEAHVLRREAQRP